MRRIPFFTVVALFAWSCSGDDGPSSDDSDTTPVADTATDGVETDAAEDTGVDVDAGDDTADGEDLEDLGDRKGFGEPCVEDNECAGNLCLYIEAGLDEGFCSGYCFEQEDCTVDEWDCIFLSNSGGDAAFVCVPEGLCLDEDGDDFGIGPGCRGPDCDESSAAVHIGADEICDGLDNDCDGAIDDNSIDAGVSCSTGFAGVCADGIQVCQNGLIDCPPLRAASAEICDGVDNDCDGSADEGTDGEPLATACYQGPAATMDVGLCVAGAQVCRDGVVSGCEGQVLPLPELCDGLDNDCDGEADEGSPEAGVYCETDLPGLCLRGRTSCSEEGVTCEPLEEPTDEICDGADNDCDGEVDEGVDGEPLAEDCYSGEPATFEVGTCAGGTRTCRGGEWSRCEGEVVPTIELCSSSDEDCDGEVNEDNPASGFLCETGDLGLCAFGRTACGSEAGTECIPDFSPEDEICDRFDNDCDGEVDESATSDGPLARECYTGAAGTEDVGVCRGGAQTCAFGGWSGCAGEVTPSIEICDGLDNDCDGQADEGNPGGGISCSTGLPGVCAAGMTACVEGGITCAGTVTATDEVCDGIDNDCDGTVDNGATWSTLGRGCFDGVGACRSAGVFVCNPADSSGPPVCGAEALSPSDEVCDGIDNDCDGAVDNGALWTQRGQVCFAGDGACRAAGVRVCDASDPEGALVCDAVEGTPGTEVCDGIDNDCDGATDEDPIWDDVGDVCSAGDGVCRRSGVLACNPSNPAGPPVCGATPGASGTEVCDGLDNDCDGETDEDPRWADAGDVCVTGQGVCQRSGVLRCNAGAPGGDLVCSATAGPSSGEVCDGLDNDCDGNIDEDFPTLGQSCTAGQGVCRAAGVVVCDGPGAVVCDAEIPDPPTETEACDYLDDDCDGLVDEDYRTGAVYGSVEHCGGCGVDCNGLWDGGPAAYSVVPECSTFGVIARCSYTCEIGSYDLDSDPANGCEFTPDEDAIYVASPDNDGVDSPSCGAFDTPCATITQGIARASDAGALRVRVSDGYFSENITLENGVSVLGGHNSVNWVRSPAVNVTVIAGVDSATDNATVLAQDITAATELSGFTINAAPGRAGGGNSVGVRIVDSDDALTVRDNRISGASGGPGSSAGDGSTGAGGLSGADGAGRVIDTTPCNTTSSGGAGGARSCGGTNVSGGDGADAECPIEGTYQDAGETGNGPAGGAGGAGGGNSTDSTIGSSWVCTITSPQSGTSGAPGLPGGDGTGGNGGSTAHALTGGHWRGRAGTAGQGGGHGSGGGGGGGGGGVDADDRSPTSGYVAPTGGGGGSGGCAGTGGQGAGAGGGSFGIVVVWTGAGPANAGEAPTIVNNRIARGIGGTGGVGGSGGSGGDPGLGGTGGYGTDEGFWDFCVGRAGNGGPGGRGGHGGGGGGGAGGASFDIFIGGAGGVSLPYGSGNTFALGAGTSTGGTGGPGGVSSNTANAGSSGSSGASGNVLALP